MEASSDLPKDRRGLPPLVVEFTVASQVRDNNKIRKMVNDHGLLLWFYVDAASRAQIVNETMRDGQKTLDTLLPIIRSCPHSRVKVHSVPKYCILSPNQKRCIPGFSRQCRCSMRDSEEKRQKPTIFRRAISLLREIFSPSPTLAAGGRSSWPYSSEPPQCSKEI